MWITIQIMIGHTHFGIMVMGQEHVLFLQLLLLVLTQLYFLARSQSLILLCTTPNSEELVIVFIITDQMSRISQESHKNRSEP